MLSIWAFLLKLSFFINQGLKKPFKILLSNVFLKEPMIKASQVMI